MNMKWLVSGGLAFVLLISISPLASAAESKGGSRGGSHGGSHAGKPGGRYAGYTPRVHAGWSPNFGYSPLGIGGVGYGGGGYGGWDYGGLWGGGYGIEFSTGYPPFYALYPPVYYSYPVARTYGYSPFAYPPYVTTPSVSSGAEQVEIAQARPPVRIINPYVQAAP